MQQPRAVLTQLQAWVKENPNRKREVIPIEICVVSDTQEGEDAPATVAGGWIPTPLEPPPMDTPELDTALCALFGYQKVAVDEANKKIEFFPADPRLWSTELPVWGATAGSRAILHRPGEEAVGDGISLWLGRREEEGWKIDWPVADGTLEEIKKKMLDHGTGVRNGLEKPKKADWAAALGRAEAIKALVRFGTRHTVAM